jgi:Asp-tRNA(Asn)/Glu-tRNA(Gln) amidotransferase A subunit family amidase
MDTLKRGGKSSPIERRQVIKGMAAAEAASFLVGNAPGTSNFGELTWLPASRLREMVVKRQVSALEITRHFLARIERLEPLFHAFSHVDRDGALAAAKQADIDLKNGKSPGALHGIPVAIKDNLWVKGMPATAGSLIFANFRPSFDGTVVERLRAAGAIILGMTNMPEFAAWPRTQSYVAGETRNPWDRDRISGASSGGSAAAVAAGMVPVAIGTDGGGSVRIPASLCGIYGLFPTLGRVPDYGGFHCSPAGSAGPMARTVGDAAMIQQVISGPDARIQGGLIAPAPDVVSGLDSGVAGLRMAWSPDFGHIPIDPLIAGCARRALDALQAAGAKVDEIADRIEHPWGDGTMMAAIREAVGAGGYPTAPEGEIPDTASAESWLAASSARVGEIVFKIPEFREFYARHSGLLTPPQRLLSGVRPATSPVPSEQELRAAMDRIFASHDLLCSPTMAVVAPIAPPGWASAYGDSFMGTNFTFIANATGRPAITVPCGFVRDLPVGLQIIGRPGDEPTVLRAARALEAILPPQATPPLT